jgi:hypothetical protein
MATLEKRITDLETKSNPGGNTPKTMIATFSTRGDTEPDIRKLRQWSQGTEGRDWVRGSGESWQEFKDRASRDATRNAWGFALLLHCTGLDDDHANT